MEIAGSNALALLMPLYDAAVIHVVAEHRDGAYHNLYTVVLYGRSMEMYTVPVVAELEFHGIDDRFVCIRQRILDLDDPILTALGSQDVSIGSCTIHYDIHRPVIGFRARYLERGPTLETSSFDTSIWVKEFGAQFQVVGSRTLSARTLPRIADELAFLKHLKWCAVDLTQHPERLGAVDIWYPSPVKLHLTNRDGEPVVVRVSDRLSFLAAKSVEIRARLFIDGLEIGTVDLTGVGPHQIAGDLDATDTELRVNGVVFDRIESSFLRSLTLGLTVQARQQNLQLTKPGKRAGTLAPINVGFTSTTTIGSLAPNRNPSRSLAHLWREQQRPEIMIAERLYDGREVDSVGKAFKDVQHLGGTIMGTTNILVVDRYSLDKDALEAIVAIAVAYPDKVTVDIATKFDDAPGASTASGTDRVNTFKRLAKSVSDQFGTHIRLHKLDGVDVHDRFLMIGDRLWHVGPSFNALGEALSALVEVRSIAIKGELLDIIKPFLQAPVFDSDVE